MKKTILLFATLLCAALTAPAQSVMIRPAAGKGDAAVVNPEIKAITDRIEAKVAAGKKTATDLAPELLEFDALIARLAGQPEEAARAALSKAILHLSTLADEPAALKLLAEVRDRYAGTQTAEAAAKWLERLSPEGRNRMQAQLAVNKEKLKTLLGAPAPEIDFVWSSRAGLKKLSDLRGKVIVLDFWATWCGPCIAVFPQIREDVAHFKDSPVAFLGVTSLQGRVNNLAAKQIDVKGDPEREYALTSDFMKKHGMTWDVVFSTQKVHNPDYLADTGIPSVSIIAPDGTVRHAGLNPNFPGMDIVGKVTAILKEFNLPVPMAKAAH